MCVDSLLTLIVTRSSLPDFSSRVRIWLYLKSHQRWSPPSLWWWVGLATLCVQGSEWPSVHQPPGSSYVSDTALYLDRTVNDWFCAVILVSSVVLRMSLLFCILK